VDGSEQSREALLLALQEAERRDAALMVARTFDAPDDLRNLYGVGPRLPSLAEVTRHLEATTRQMVHEVVAQHDGPLAGVVVDVVAVPGYPAHVLLDQARFTDLLVVGHADGAGSRVSLSGRSGCSAHCTPRVRSPCPGPGPGGRTGPA
jgi:nucleotide-binding universal stress UspA family protein